MVQQAHEVVDVKTIEIDGKDYFLIETIDIYNFFVEEENIENICVLKTIIEDGKSYYVDVDDREFDKAFIMYYEKLKSSN